MEEDLVAKAMSEMAAEKSAAAAVGAIAVPSALSLGGDNVKTVKIGDTEAYFCCNNDCDAESTIEMFNALIH